METIVFKMKDVFFLQLKTYTKAGSDSVEQQTN